MGTLVSLTDPVPALRAQLAQRLRVDVGQATARAALRAEVGYYHTHMQDGADAPSLAALRQRCAHELSVALGPVVARADPALMTEILLASLRFSAHADAPGALRRVREAGSRIVVVSNWDISLVDVLEQTGLAPLLDGVVSSAAVGARKPDSEIFAAALALAGVGPERAVHVGDSPSQDVAGARACGIRAVLLDRSVRAGAQTAPRAPVAVIASLSELSWPP